MKKNKLSEILNYIGNRNIVDYEVLDDKIEIDAFDILNSDNKPILVDKILIEDNKVSFLNNKNQIIHQKTYDVSIEDMFNDIYENIVFLNFLGKIKEDYLK